MLCVVSLLAVWQTEFSHSKPKTKDLEEVEIEFFDLTSGGTSSGDAWKKNVRRYPIQTKATEEFGLQRH